MEGGGGERDVGGCFVAGVSMVIRVDVVISMVGIDIDAFVRE